MDERPLLIRDVLLNGTATDVRIENGRFVRIAPHQKADGTERVLNGHNKAIVPPFYNAHTHAAMSLLRGAADDLPLHTWLNHYIWPAEAMLTPQDIYDGSRLAILEMIQSGTLFFNDMYWFQAETLRAAHEMGIRYAAGLVLLERAENDVMERTRRENESLAQAVETAGDARYSTLFAPHALYTVSEETLRRIAKESRTTGRKIHMHVAETEQEVSDCFKTHHCTPVEYLETLGLLSERLIAVHAVHLTEHDRELLAARNVTLVHCPHSNLKLASGAFDYEAARACGIRVLIGTDGAASNNALSMFGELKTAALLAKLKTGNPAAGNAHALYASATVQAAEAFGIHAGIIAEGYEADALLLDLNAPAMGGFDLISDMVYAADSAVVDTAVCAGRIVMENRHVPQQEAIIRAGKAARERIAGAFTPSPLNS